MEGSPESRRTFLDYQYVSAKRHENPQPKRLYNLLVVGAGSAGLVSARMASSFGATVALVEKHLMGGDCLNFGCVPSKALLHASRQRPASFESMRQHVDNCRLQIAEHDSVESLNELGIDVFFSQNGHFVGKNVFKIEAGKEIRFHRAIIATGSSSWKQDIIGLDNVSYWTNEHIFDLKSMPKTLVIAGGGPIGCEIGQAFNRFGVNVTILERNSHILAKEDDEVGSALCNVLQQEGVRVFTECIVCKVRPSSSKDDIEICYKTKEQNEGTWISASAFLLAAGRVPNIAGLGLDACGIEHNDRGIIVDRFLKTTNKRVFAAGDCCHELKFTHAAAMMARIAVENALFQTFFKMRVPFESAFVPWVTYTYPEVAHVGKSEKLLTKEKIPVVKTTVLTTEVDRFATDQEPEGFITLLTHKKTYKILGVVVVCAYAGEIIGEITLAMRMGLTPRDLSLTVHPYPTRSELVARVCEKWHLDLTLEKYGSLLGGWMENTVKQ